MQDHNGNTATTAVENMFYQTVFHHLFILCTKSNVISKSYKKSSHNYTLTCQEITLVLLTLLRWNSSFLMYLSVTFTCWLKEIRKSHLFFAFVPFITKLSQDFKTSMSLSEGFKAHLVQLIQETLQGRKYQFISNWNYITLFIYSYAGPKVTTYQSRVPLWFFYLSGKCLQVHLINLQVRPENTDTHTLVISLSFYEMHLLGVYSLKAFLQCFIHFIQSLWLRNLRWGVGLDRHSKQSACSAGLPAETRSAEHHKVPAAPQTPSHY